MNVAGSRLLLVEDEPIIGFALEDMMIEAGADIRFAATLEQGLALAEANAFDGAVIDVNLHGMTSYPLARRLLENGVAVLFATGYGDRTCPDDLRGVPTLTKPYTKEAIEQAFAAMV